MASNRPNKSLERTRERESAKPKRRRARRSAQLLGVMKAPHTTLPPDLWLRDGSLRDVYLSNTSQDDWDAFLTVVTQYPSEYLFDGEVKGMPNLVAIFENREGTHLLRITVGAAQINCHFFTPEEIELDVDPRQVESQETHAAVLSFVEAVAAATGKLATITPENSPESPILSYEPEGERWRFHGPKQRAVNDA